MKTYNPESRAEEDKKVLKDLKNLVQEKLRCRVVEWMRKDQNSKEDFEADKEEKYKDFTFTQYLEAMV